MDLTGKYLAFWLSGESVDEAFGLPGPSTPGGKWMVMGPVRGETSGVGVWVSVESVTNPAGKTAQMTPPMDKTPTLFRWEWITGAIASDSRPEKRPIGFLSDLRGGKKGIS